MEKNLLNKTVKGYTIGSLKKIIAQNPHFNTVKNALDAFGFTVVLINGKEDKILKVSELRKFLDQNSWTEHANLAIDLCSEYEISSRPLLEQRIVEAEQMLLIAEQAKKALEQKEKSNEQKIAELEQKLKDAEIELNSFYARQNDNEQLAERARDRVNRLEQEKNSIEQRLIERELNLNLLEQQVNELNKQMLDSSKNVEQLRTENEQLVRTSKELRTNLNTLEDEIQPYRAEKDKVKNTGLIAFNAINLLLTGFMMISCLLIFTNEIVNWYSVGFGLTLSFLFAFLGLAMHSVIKQGSDIQKKVAFYVLGLLSISEIFIHYKSVTHFVSADVVGNVPVFAGFVAVIVAIINYVSFWFKK